MEDQTVDKSAANTSRSNTTPIRISQATARSLRSIIAKCNRKSHGRKIRADDVIKVALTLIQDHHISEIKLSSYSSQDQLEIEYKKYCKSEGTISKDDFLKFILSKAISQSSQVKGSDQKRGD